MADSISPRDIAGGVRLVFGAATSAARVTTWPTGNDADLLGAGSDLAGAGDAVATTSGIGFFFFIPNISTSQKQLSSRTAKNRPKLLPSTILIPSATGFTDAERFLEISVWLIHSP